MGVTYFKRFRMEIDLRGRSVTPIHLPVGYRIVPWSEELLADHAEAKFYSFVGSIDSSVFSCLGDLEGCRRLMEEISRKDGFLPEATWLAEYIGAGPHRIEPCGTIQGIRVNRTYGGIQNIGITPLHRGRGLGTALVLAALAGFQQMGLARAYLEVTAQNTRAVELYKRMGFRRSKTLYKAVELAYS
jgi:ribosomal protein S18 acetylase RimI-like enzyme